MITTLRQMAAQRGASVVFVQADTGVENEAAIALLSLFLNTIHQLQQFGA
ncbi:hypothetical protein [Saccharospirillum sp.]